MRVLVIGGTGRTGKLVIDEALERGLFSHLFCVGRCLYGVIIGYTVTTLARDPNALKPRIGLTIVKGMHDRPQNTWYKH
jgi:uncharacterized protein YbjT (DUF2867 family)